MRRRYGFGLGILLLSAAVQAGAALYPLKNENDYPRFVQLSKSLRCMICQNESLEGSQAQFAIDLKHRIVDMLNANYSDEQIKAALVARYGEAIRYQPAFNRNTYFLWALPAILLFIAAGVMSKLYWRSE